MRDRMCEEQSMIVTKFLSEPQRYLDDRCWISIDFCVELIEGL